MSEEMLLIAFVSFIVLLLILVLVLRNLSVQDVLGKDDHTDLLIGNSPSTDLYPQPQTQRSATPSLPKNASPNFELNRENVHKLSRALSIIGAVALFLPTPDFVNFLGLAFLFLGSIVSRATKPAEQKKKRKTSQNQTVQKIRLLANRPEYGEALKLLYADKKENPQAADDVHYRRAVQYLERRGVSPVDARRNLALLAGVMAKGRN